MKQFFLMAAFILIASMAAKAQHAYMKFNNTMGYTVYVSGLWGANTTCTSSGNYTYAVPPGNSVIDVSMYGGNIATDEFFHIRVYDYDPTTTCASASVNISPCLIGNFNAALQTFDTCPGVTTLTNIDWSSVPNVIYIDIHP